MGTYSSNDAAVNNYINEQQHFIFHISSHGIAFIALIVACFAITGYIRYRRLPKDTIMMPKKESHPQTSPPGHPPVNNRTLNDISHIDTNIYHPSDSMLPYVMVSSTDHNVQTPGALQMSALDIYIDESDTTFRTGFMQSNGFLGPELKDDPNFELNAFPCSTLPTQYPGICIPNGGSFKPMSEQNIQDSFQLLMKQLARPWQEGDTSGETWGANKVDIAIVREKCALSCQQYQEGVTGENVPTYICKLPTIPNGQIVSGFFECLAENTFVDNFKPTLFITEDGTLSATNSNLNNLKGEYLTGFNGPDNFKQGDKVNFTENNKVSLRNQKYLYIKTNTNNTAGEYSGSFHIHLKITSTVPH